MYTYAFGSANRLLSQYSSAFGRSNTISASGASVYGYSISNAIAGSTMIGPNETAKVTILSGGQMGIGTSSPVTKLQVTEGKVAISETNSAWGMLQLGNPTVPGPGNLSQTSISFMP